MAYHALTAEDLHDAWWGLCAKCKPVTLLSLSAVLRADAVHVRNRLAELGYLALLDRPERLAGEG